MKKLFHSLKYIKRGDLLAPLIFLVAAPIGGIYKAFLYITNQHLWLVAEGRNDARDNGYVLFKYIRQTHPSLNVHYAIDTQSLAAKKLANLGNLVHYGSFKHWVYYLAATKNITIHKAANPNPPLFYVLHRMRIVNGHRIFLQHGVTMNNVSYLHFNETRFELFICGATPEYEYVKKKFGYPPGRVAYLGFPRFDTLMGQLDNVDKKQLVIMPTWRSWLGREHNSFSQTQAITESLYFKTYQSLINNKTLIDFIEKNDITVYFFQHANMERYAGSFSTSSKNIHIVTSKNADIQHLIARSAFMITDYSSVSIDFAYMGKPLVYYQFDEREFRTHHLSEGYFSYHADGFGPVVDTERNLVDTMIRYAAKQFMAEELYVRRSQEFFALRDASNSERVFDKISALDNLKGEKS